MLCQSPWWHPPRDQIHICRRSNQHNILRGRRIVLCRERISCRQSRCSNDSNPFHLLVPIEISHNVSASKFHILWTNSVYKSLEKFESFHGNPLRIRCRYHWKFIQMNGNLLFKNFRAVISGADINVVLNLMQIIKIQFYGSDVWPMKWKEEPWQRRQTAEKKRSLIQLFAWLRKSKQFFSLSLSSICKTTKISIIVIVCLHCGWAWMPQCTRKKYFSLWIDFYI